jgi:flagellar basal-body rod modification protein FlgD
MEIPAEFQIQNRLAAQSAEQQHEPGELGRDAFLSLLIKQLENQDPLSPMQDHEFVAQLATFSSLEQLEGIHGSLQASLLMNQSVNNALATNLIGKEILADGSTLRLGETGSPSFQIRLDSDADLAVLIRDDHGNLVKRLSPGALPAGDHPVVWDGTTQSGTRAEPGSYSVEVVATGANGDAVGSTVRIRALVTGVRFEGGSGYLMLGDQSIPISSVMEVFAATV